MGSRQWAVGSGQSAVGSRQWAVGNRGEVADRGRRPLLQRPRTAARGIPSKTNLPVSAEESFETCKLAEQWIKEGKSAVKWTKLSCRTFKDNQTRLQLFALAYNLANFLRRLAVPKSICQWTLTTLREKLIKIGAKVTRHSKYVTFQLAGVAVTRDLFAAIFDRIARSAIPPPPEAREHV